MFARGGESDYNLVLIDGVRVNLSGGTFDFSRDRRRRDRSRRGRARRAVGAVGLRRDGLGGADLHRAGPATARRRAVVAVARGWLVRHVARRCAASAAAPARRVNYHAGVSRRHDRRRVQRPAAGRRRLLADGVRRRRRRDARHRARTLRGSVRYSEADGRSRGPDHLRRARHRRRLRHQGSVSGHVDCRSRARHALHRDRRPSTTSATRACRRTPLPMPAFSTYAILTGTPNALFPNGTRLVRLIDVRPSSTPSSRPAPCRRPGSSWPRDQRRDFPFTTSLPTEFARPAFRYQGDYRLGGGQRLSAGYEWEREEQSRRRGLPISTTTRSSSSSRSAIGDRWFVTVGGRVDSKEQLRHVLQPQAVGRRLRACPSRRRVVVAEGVRQHRQGHQVADLQRAVRRRRSPIPIPDLKVERARTGDVGVEATFADQRFLAPGRLLQQRLHRSDRVPAAAWPATASLSTSTSTARRPTAGSSSGRCSAGVGGVTASATYAHGRHRVVTNISTSQQFQPGQPLLRRPKHSGTVRAVIRARPAHASTPTPHRRRSPRQQLPVAAHRAECRTADRRSPPTSP